MKLRYLVLYRIEKLMTALEQPFGFFCYADSLDHAEEQCLGSYPDCNVVWVYQTTQYLPRDAYEEALEDYYVPQEVS